MTVIVVGVDHRRSPAEVVERLVAGSGLLVEAAESLLRGSLADEVVPLCTCLRSELYLSTADPALAIAELSKAVGIDRTFVYEGEVAANHLFRIACGLQSTVLGEAEILGQIARTWETSRLKGTSGPVLDSLFRHAVSAGKRARRDTLIGHGVTSIAQAGVAMVKDQVLHMQGKRVLVIGAGDMGERMANAVARADGIGTLTIANRTWERAHALASQVGGAAIEFSAVEAALKDADVVFTSTASSQPIISVDAASRCGDLVIVDFAVPRDTEAGVEDLPNVNLLLLEDLQAFAAAGAEARAGEAAAVEQIVDDEVRRYELYKVERSVTPAISAVREYAESIRGAEFSKFAQKGKFDAEQLAAIDLLTKSIVNKFMHQPTVRLKEAANESDAEQIVDIVRRMFDS